MFNPHASNHTTFLFDNMAVQVMQRSGAKIPIPVSTVQYHWNESVKREPLLTENERVQAVIDEMVQVATPSGQGLGQGQGQGLGQSPGPGQGVESPSSPLWSPRSFHPEHLGTPVATTTPAPVWNPSEAPKVPIPSKYRFETEVECGNVCIDARHCDDSGTFKFPVTVNDCTGVKIRYLVFTSPEINVMPPYNVLQTGQQTLLPQGFYTPEELQEAYGLKQHGRQWYVDGVLQSHFRVVRELTILFCCPELRIRYPVHLQNKECRIVMPSHLESLFEIPRPLSALSFYFELWNGERVPVQFTVVLALKVNA